MKRWIVTLVITDDGDGKDQYLEARGIQNEIEDNLDLTAGINLQSIFVQEKED